MAVLGPLVAAALVAGCSTRPAALPPGATAGDVAAGQEALSAYGCGACHRIPGIRGANALVGPPLDSWSQRTFVAGLLPNNQASLERWIRDPQGVQPGNAMPDLDVTEADARDMAAYLLTLD
jgi:cytochrome c